MVGWSARKLYSSFNTVFETSWVQLLESKTIVNQKVRGSIRGSIRVNSG